MKNLPHYTKIITLGSSYTENALVGEVTLQEKIDGSQFRWGLNEDKELIIGSKGTIIRHPDENKMFKEGVEYLLSIEDKLKNDYLADTYFFGEYLQKPKHNVLKYERIPKNHIVLFDVLMGGKWIRERKELEEIAKNLDIDIIPELYKGEMNKEKIKELLIIDSYLGNEKIEGIVIKNYNQTIMLGGNIFPLFTKYVREEFKERHCAEWKIKSPKGALQEFIESFKSEARWTKAIIHLKEKELLTNSPKDIGLLIKTVQNDIVEEEKDNIKKFLYNKFIKDILRVSTKGLPEYYKEKLLENVK